MHLQESLLHCSFLDIHILKTAKKNRNKKSAFQRSREKSVFQHFQAKWKIKVSNALVGKEYWDNCIRNVKEDLILYFRLT